MRWSAKYHITRDVLATNALASMQNVRDGCAFTSENPPSVLTNYNDTIVIQKAKSSGRVFSFAICGVERRVCEHHAR
jgi:hypothetical protein